MFHTSPEVLDIFPKRRKNLTYRIKNDKIIILFVPGLPPRLRKEGGSALGGEGS
jgi:hypothetical protein